MFIQKNKMKRREFIRNIAKAGMLAPFASQFLFGGRVNAAPLGTANRLIVVYYPNGANLEKWHTNDINNLNFAMTPLEPYSHYLTEFRNLTSVGAGGSSSSAQAASAILSGGVQNGPTIDSAIAHALGQPNIHRAMHFGLFTRYALSSDYFPFRDVNGYRILPEDDPNTASRLYFGDIPSRNQESSTALRLSILESMEADLTQLQSHVLNNAQRSELDKQAESMARFGSLLRSNLNIQDIVHNVSMGPNQLQNNEVAEDICRAQFKNLAVGLEADLTRVSVFQFMAAQDESLLINFESLEEDLTAAGYWGERRYWNENRSVVAKSMSGELFATQNKWYNMMMAELCRELSSRQDPLGGGSLLDTSLILMCTEMGGAPQNGEWDIPWYLLGGANGAVNNGQVIDCTGKNSANLLLEIARMMGLNWSAFGSSGSGIEGLKT